MRTALTLMLAVVLLCPLAAHSTIINIPDDYPAIQEGIDHSRKGDTVLVQPGSYVENINFNAHNVVLASLFLTTGDTAYISSTIIDGDSAGSVITFVHGEGRTAQVVGFTIQRGRMGWGGGVSCRQGSSPRIRANIISGNSAGAYGGGIVCGGYSSPGIENNIIRDNYAADMGAGILCSGRSDPTIEGNTITGNYSWGSGGGIGCNGGCNPTISNNNLSENRCRFYGAGIYCYDRSHPRITNNVISGNSAEDDLKGYGGGIYCNSHCRPTITKNTISENFAGVDGGGICCEVWCDPVITGNTISANSVAADGGGMWFCSNCSPMISGNIVAWNSADGGGGVFAQNSNPVIVGNIINGNSAVDRGGGIWIYKWPPFSDRYYITILSNTLVGNVASSGGGIYCSGGVTTITNTILWGNTAPNGPEMCLGQYASPTATYCDIRGGWPGQGNIDADPIFVAPEREDFILRWRSPCIDAGVPDSLDPDGTRSDLGALYFNQDVDAVSELYPHNTPIVIPAQGGDIIYDGWVFNFRGQSSRADIWTYVLLPDGQRYGPIDLYQDIRIPVDSLGMDEITQPVPQNAPGGHYVFVVYVGEYSNSIIDSSYFHFTKSGSIAGSAEDWLERGGWFTVRESVDTDLPSRYALSPNYPNPFNARTAIKYELPVDGHAELEIYNARGQRVARLIDGPQEAGHKSVIWDASQFSSGLYFYKLTAGDFVEVRMMTLVK